MGKELRCLGCRRIPEDIPEVQEMGRSEGMTPSEFVEKCEGTYDKTKGSFYCTNCYIKAEMPVLKLYQ